MNFPILLVILSFLINIVASQENDKVVKIQLQRKQYLGRVDKQYNRRLQEIQNRGRNLQYEYQVDVANNHNYQYFGKLWIGTHRQEMTFIFDTGSAWTWIPSEDCDKAQCTKNHYQYKQSEGFKKTGDQTEIFYGIGYVKGDIVNDDISITNSKETAAKDVNFLSVTSAKDLNKLVSDGLLGLSPKVIYNAQKVHLLVDQLKEDKIISKAMFALYLTETESQSLMQFGGYDKEIVARSLKENKNEASDSPDGIYWMQINSNQHWQVRIYNAKIGDQQIYQASYNMIFDSGSSLNYIPKKEFQQFKQEILKNHTCITDKNDGLMKCVCSGITDDSFPTLSVHIGSSKQLDYGSSQHWFYMKGSDYMTYSPITRKCSVLVKAELDSVSSIWLMGDPFLRAYYSIYDMESGRIGLVGIAESQRIKQKEASSKAEIDDVDAILEKMGITESNEYVAEIILGIFIVLLILCCCCCLQYFMLKNKNKVKKRQSTEIQLEQMQIEQLAIEAQIKMKNFVNSEKGVTVEHVNNELDQLERIKALSNRNYGMENPYHGTNKNECMQPDFDQEELARNHPQVLPPLAQRDQFGRMGSSPQRFVKPESIILTDAEKEAQEFREAIQRSLDRPQSNLDEIDRAIQESLKPNQLPSQPEPGFRMDLNGFKPKPAEYGNWDSQEQNEAANTYGLQSSQPGYDHNQVQVSEQEAIMEQIIREQQIREYKRSQNY